MLSGIYVSRYIYLFGMAWPCLHLYSLAWQGCTKVSETTLYCSASQICIPSGIFTPSAVQSLFGGILYPMPIKPLTERHASHRCCSYALTLASYALTSNASLLRSYLSHQPPMFLCLLF